MRALLDTSALLLPRDRLATAIAGYADVAISVATVGEIEHGLLVAGTDWELRFRRDLAHRRMLQLFKVLPFDRAAAREYAKVCVLVRERGRTHRRRAVDLMIAATASAHRIPLVTANAADLRGAEALVQIVAVDPA
ncbi:MAG: PIN domain-containing protein [Gaiellales bacterium]